MSQFNLLMPKMGESVEEATITKWFVKEGDTVVEDDVLLEIATDKVDSEIPSPVAGKISKIFFQENDKVVVGKVIALINTGGDDDISTPSADHLSNAQTEQENVQAVKEEKQEESTSGRFYSPLVKSISKQEGISTSELDSIDGSGQGGRVRKEDVLGYLANRENEVKTTLHKSTSISIKEEKSASNETVKASPSLSAGDEIIEMDRMRKLIAEHMVRSKQISAHVTNMVEVDVTNLVMWRKTYKNEFEKREKTKLTYMPAFIEAAAAALRDYPMVNSSVDGNNIILHKAVNVGVAVALPSGNLIVPVIKNADQRNIIGLANEMNRLADLSRINKLMPDDIAGGTFTISNFGSFRNVMGTPVINQPQVAILATGTIEKKPAVVETPAGDVIAIRHKMFLSLTYDHRIIDGALGGGFLRKIADYLENWDVNRKS
jgi:2-oxoglutarate dehydrogenase E2 component (dihydrolipoamide succinyltransferase)